LLTAGTSAPQEAKPGLSTPGGCGMFTHLVYLWTLPWGDTECEGSDSLQLATLFPSILNLNYVAFRAAFTRTFFCEERLE